MNFCTLQRFSLRFLRYTFYTEFMCSTLYGGMRVFRFCLTSSFSMNKISIFHRRKKEVLKPLQSLIHIFKSSLYLFICGAFTVVAKFFLLPPTSSVNYVFNYLEYLFINEKRDTFKSGEEREEQNSCFLCLFLLLLSMWRENLRLCFVLCLFLRLCEFVCAAFFFFQEWLYVFPLIYRCHLRLRMADKGIEHNGPWLSDNKGVSRENNMFFYSRVLKALGTSAFVTVNFKSFFISL